MMRNNSKSRLLAPILLAIFIAAILVAFLIRVELAEGVRALFKPKLPEAVEVGEVAKLSAPSVGDKVAEDAGETVVASLPAEMNLKIPFQSQAPFSNWDAVHEETCEEASAIMVDRFFSGKPLTKDIMEEELGKLIAWENDQFGRFEDTDGAETVRILREYFGRTKVLLRYGFTIEDVKKEVAAGRPVILLAAGRLLGNPNFTPPGPVYHALVVKGYLKDGRIITNDPGTRKGADYLYDPEVLMRAAHEWNGIGDVLDGRKVMISVGPETSSQNQN
jgi:hypothetical protein